MPRCDRPTCRCHGRTFLWVSHYHRYIWCEIPKSASTTLKKVLPRRRENQLEHDELETLGDEYTAFGVVRNPWDRLLACYLMFIQFRNNTFLEMFGNRSGAMPFSDFVPRSREVRNHHWAPCSEFLAIGRPIKLIRFETFEESLVAMCRCLDCDVGTVSHWNKSEPRCYREFYDDDMAQVVAEAYADDIALGRYAF